MRAPKLPEGQKYIIVQERPKKAKTGHFKHFIILFALMVIVPPLALFYLIFYVLSMFETRRTNRINGY